MPLRAITWGGRRVTFVPSKKTCPAVFGTKPVTRLTNVVLPAPLGPTRPTISPLGMLTETLSTAVTPPKRRVRPSSRSAGSVMALDPLGLDGAVARTSSTRPGLETAAGHRVGPHRSL